jgi:hypothetical protein
MWQCMAMANHLSVYYFRMWENPGELRKRVAAGCTGFWKAFYDVSSTPHTALRTPQESVLFIVLLLAYIPSVQYIQRSDKTNFVQYSPMLADVEDFQMLTFFSEAILSFSSMQLLCRGKIVYD